MIHSTFLIDSKVEETGEDLCDSKKVETSDTKETVYEIPLHTKRVGK